MQKLNLKLIGFLIFFFGVIIGTGYVIYSILFGGKVEKQPIAVQPEISGQAPKTFAPSLLPAEERQLAEITGEVPSEQARIPSAEQILGAPSLEISKIAAGGITQVTALTDLSEPQFTLSFNGKNINYYDEIDGKFYELTPDGTVKAITEKSFPFAQNVVWSPNSEQSILEFPDGSNILFNLKDETQVTLPRHWKDFDFAPTGNTVALKSLGYDEDQRWLAVSEPDGSKIKLIENLGYNDGSVTIDWSPTNQVVAYQVQAVNDRFQEVFFVGLHDENFKSLKVEGFGFRGQWSPEGDKMLYSVYNADTDYKPLLWIADASGDNTGNNKRLLNVATWADKCTFSKNNRHIFCAIPEKMEKGIGMMPILADEEPYDFYKIDTQTGARQLLAIPDTSTSVNKVSLSKGEEYLYFTDAQTGQIKKINLK